MQADLNITPGAGPETDAATTAVEDAERLTPKLRTDHHVWGIYIALLIISVIELFSASSQEVSPDDIYGPIIRHARFLGIGLLLMLVIQKFHYVYILKAVPWYLAGSIGAMILVLVAGVKINGTMRGLQVGPLTVLPAEFLKLGAALGVAWILSRNQMPGKRDVTTKGVVYCTLLILFCCGLLLEQGLTNTLLLMAISLSMMLIGGVSLKKFAGVLLVYGVLAGGYFAVRSMTKEEGPSQAAIEVARLNQEEVGESEAIKRMGTWKARFSRHFRLNKYNDDITDENKQEQLSYIAQAHGGLLGVGPGNSRENARLPLAFSDYIYAIVIEELGLITGVFLLICYLWLLARAGWVATRCKQTFPCLLVIGCAIYIVYQALFHMAIVTGVFPVSGQPLPLISKGGTSVIVTSIALGIMLSTCRHAAFKDDKEAIRKEIEALPENMQSDNPSQL
ncbi:MAG: FtsW/RodA/SpoVE family cell cycle protein [Muribaculaceae bacterium]